jgi:hypothetical protein
MEELRARRGTCQAIEVALSYQRRMAQGRLDIVGAERGQRAGGSTRPTPARGPRSSSSTSAGVLADRGRSPGFGHMPQLMAPEDGRRRHQRARRHRPPDGARAPWPTPTTRSSTAWSALSEYERAVSSDRRALHGAIDALQAEIARRYQTGEATVDSLLR